MVNTRFVEAWRLIAFLLVFGPLNIGVSHGSVISPAESLAESALRDLEGEKSEMRIRAIRTLGLFPGMAQAVGNVGARLVDVLKNDPDPVVRAEAAYVLAELADPITACPELVSALMDRECGTRQAVAFLFGRRDLLQNLDPELRASAIKTLESMIQHPTCPAERVMATYALLSPDFKESVGETFFSTVVESAQRLLFEIITVPDELGLRPSQYARVLAELDVDKAIGVIDGISAMTESDDQAIAGNSAQVLVEFGDCFGEDLLATTRQRCLQSAEECTKALNTLVFFALKDEGAVSFVQEKLSSRDEPLILAAIAVLRSMGAAAKAAVPRLFALLESDNPQVRTASAWTIVEISPESTGTVASRVRETDPDLAIELLKDSLRRML
ncbi:MAG: HEAT repeat domain-containing protein [Proteobacteria bacterium]|nr:HEAT repeat domain-containing protein [Pseudomonadota bacterium]